MAANVLLLSVLSDVYSESITQLKILVDCYDVFSPLISDSKFGYFIYKNFFDVFLYFLMQCCGEHDLLGGSGDQRRAKCHLLGGRTKYGSDKVKTDRDRLHAKSSHR